MAHAANKHERRAIGQRKLKQLYEATKNAYGGGGAWKNEENRIVQYWDCPGAKRFLKRHSAKIIRKTTVISNGMAYRKAFDYWWALY